MQTPHRITGMRRNLLALSLVVAAVAAMAGSLEAAEREAERLDQEMEHREEIAEARFEKLVIRAIESGKAAKVK